MSYGDRPFGLHEVKLKRGATVIALPASRVLKIKERVKSSELEGDDAILSVNSTVDAAEFELEAGGISLEAYGLMTGRSTSVEGVTPNESKTLRGRAGDHFPYFTIYGKVLGENADDIHCKVFKAKLTEGMDGSFQYGQFFVNTCKGIAVDDGTHGIWEFAQNETATALPAA